MGNAVCAGMFELGHGNKREKISSEAAYVASFEPQCFLDARVNPAPACAGTLHTVSAGLDRRQDVLHVSRMADSHGLHSRLFVSRPLHVTHLGTPAPFRSRRASRCEMGPMFLVCGHLVGEGGDSTRTRG